MECPFCNQYSDQILFESEFGYVIYDGYPVSPGHILVIPKQHNESYFDLSDEVSNELSILLKQTKKLLDKERKPDCYNVGINAGLSAGQIINHAHIL